MKTTLPSILVTAILLSFGVNGRGQAVERVIREFGFVDQAGVAGSLPIIMGADGRLYGTGEGGAEGWGLVYRMNADGSGHTALHSFSPTAGGQPNAWVIQGSDGYLYGTTHSGGASNVGTVFKLATDGTGFSVLHDFTGFPADGANPFAPLIQAGDGTLYGTTFSGGSGLGGTVFRINPDGTGYSVVRHFSPVSSGPINPRSPLLSGADGGLYGTTFSGGTMGLGAVFRINTNGAGYSTLFNFGTLLSGSHPIAPLIQGPLGTLYGTTFSGGLSNAGIIFRLTTNGSSFGIVVNFGPGANGQNPAGSLWLGPDGGFYGTTSSGGTNDGGVVFRVNTNGTGYSVLYPFNRNFGEGSRPSTALVPGATGMLYGVTMNGGIHGLGTLFQIATNGTAYKIVHYFGLSGGDARDLRDGVIQGIDGGLYGTAASGGTNGRGVVFRLSLDGADYQLLHQFGDANNNGTTPEAALCQAQDGMLYGTTLVGGTNNCGTLFKLNTNGTGHTILHDFSSGGGGVNSYAAPIQGNDGLLYVTTESAVSKISTNGTGFTVLHFFSPTNGLGHSLRSSVIQGIDGMLYGTTTSGGFSNAGTIFKISTDGSDYAVIHDFGDPGDGQNPWTAVLQGSDGILYGTTGAGGDSGNGTIFRINTNGGDYAVLHSFASVGDGRDSRGPLFEGPDGALYGTTVTSTNGLGAVFRLNRDGTDYCVIYNFPLRYYGAVNRDGATPYGTLIRATDGALYGCTSGGGVLNNGVVFQLDLRPAITNHPQSQTVLFGTPAIFEAGAASYPPLSYQWFFNATNALSATDPFLSLPAVVRTNAGVYSVQVTNAFGSATSSNATLTVQVPQVLAGIAPSGDGGFQFTSAYLDGFPIDAGELARFDLEHSRNLLNWSILPNALVWSNGVIVGADTNPAAQVQFYRVVEH